jgi:hypothetical protein
MDRKKLLIPAMGFRHRPTGSREWKKCDGPILGKLDDDERAEAIGGECWHQMS